MHNDSGVSESLTSFDKSSSSLVAQSFAGENWSSDASSHSSPLVDSTFLTDCSLLVNLSSSKESASSMISPSVNGSALSASNCASGESFG